MEWKVILTMMSYSDVLVIKMIVASREVRRVYVQNGDVSILYSEMLQKVVH